MPVALDRAAERRMSDSAKLVADLAAGDAPVYGVNTGFGDLATVRIPIGELRALQRNLIRSHAAGVGDPLPVDVVRAVLLLRANTLAAGRSGDLAPLAHAALVLMGEGEAFLEDARLSGADALKRAGLKPLELGPKEG